VNVNSNNWFSIPTAISLSVLFYTPIKIRLYRHAGWLLVSCELTKKKKRKKKGFITSSIIKGLWLIVPQVVLSALQHSYRQSA